MSDYFDMVERGLRAAVRREAHLPWYVRLARRRQNIGRRPLLAILAVLVLAGSAAAAVLSLSRSRPLSGSVPGGFLYPLHTAGGLQYRVSVFPYLSVGWTGWCSSVNFTVGSRVEETSYGCAPVEVSNPVVLYGAAFGNQRGFYQYSIFSDRVAEVRYSDGSTVKPIADPRLPRWARAAVRVNTAHSMRIGSEFRMGLLDAGGRRLSEPPILRADSIEHLPWITLNATRPANLPCAVHARAIPGLVALSQTVTTPVAWPRRAPGGFLACANAVYRLDGTNLGVAVLLNALDPRRPADPLPGLTHDPSDPGILLGGELGTIGYPEGNSADSPDARTFDIMGPHPNNPGEDHPWDLIEEHNARNHNISARRAGPGWLIAEGGTPRQRAILLNALHTE